MGERVFRCVMHVSGHPSFATRVPKEPAVGDEFELDLPTSRFKGSYRIVRIERESAVSGSGTSHIYCEESRPLSN